MPLVSVGRERAEGVMTERYTYDPLRRLTGVTDSKGFRAVYEYDAAGNRTRRLVKEYDPKTGAGGVKRTEYVLDDRDPVVEYFIWNGQREEFYRGGVEAFSPTPMLLYQLCWLRPFCPTVNRRAQSAKPPSGAENSPKGFAG